MRTNYSKQIVPIRLLNDSIAHLARTFFQGTEAIAHVVSFFFAFSGIFYYFGLLQHAYATNNECLHKYFVSAYNLSPLVVFSVNCNI